MNLINTVVSFIVDGGFWMYPILLVGAAGVAIAIERFIKLGKVERDNRAAWDQLYPVLSKGDFEKARTMVADDPSTVSQLLQMGLERQGAVRHREEIEIAMEEEMMAIIPQLEKRTSYLALYANLATLLGLLGTIVGLIQAFDAVAHASAAEKADMLSASISVAMNTTALGLMVAIPMLIMHSYLTTKAGAIIDSLEIASVKTLNAISSFAKRQAE